MGGRRAAATPILDNKKARKTKAELKAREAVEKELQKIQSTLICPPDLDGRAKKLWGEIVTLVQSSEYNFLNDLDAGLLRCYCESVERYEVAAYAWRKTLRKKIVGKGLEEQRVIDRCLTEMSRAGEEMGKYARSLNLTSAERGRIAAMQGSIAKKQKSAMTRFMNDDP